MAENKTKSVNTSQVAWCSEEPLFQADEPEVDCVDEAHLNVQRGVHKYDSQLQSMSCSTSANRKTVLLHYSRFDTYFCHTVYSTVHFCFFNIQAWKWCAIPLVIYVTERLTRLFRSFQKVQLIQVNNLTKIRLSGDLELLDPSISFSIK